MKLNIDKRILTQKERSSPLPENDFEIKLNSDRTRTAQMGRKNSCC